MPGFTRALVASAIAIGASALCTCAPASPATTLDPPIAVTAQDWTTYHHDNVRTATDGDTAHMTVMTNAWSFQLPPNDASGQIYGEPVEAGHLVIITTESDWVYALDVTTGALRWRDHLATPGSPVGVCGNISPTIGVTSTPVIDAQHGEVFVVAAVGVGTRAHGLSHHLFGLSLRTGAVRYNRAIDPPGQQPLYLLQRAALALDGHRVLVAMGGNYGDCGDYHGWLQSIDGQQVGAPIYRFEVAAGKGQYQGAIWMGGAAPAIDATGRIFVAAGNGAATNPAGPYDHSDAVLALSPTLGLIDQFAPSTWAADNASDLDLGSTAPQLLPGGLLFQVGKSGTGYLLAAHALGGVGARVPTTPMCGGSEAFGGAATIPGGLVVACTNGLTFVAVTQHRAKATIGWVSALATGPPISAGGYLWGIAGNTTSASMYSVNAATGKPGPFRAAIGGIATHFATPSAADGFIFAASAKTLWAFPIR